MGNTDGFFEAIAAQGTNKTVDFDVFGEADQIPVCHIHQGLVEEIIQRDLKKIGQETAFGENGYGRA